MLIAPPIKAVVEASHVPLRFSDLSPAERLLATTIADLWFGRFESIRIDHGQPVLDPWPVIVRGVKFGSDALQRPRSASEDFELKRQCVELFDYIRRVGSGEIRCLEVRHGIPFSMEVHFLPGVTLG
jgi:hypothetical protein